ncbi:hypothetical protein [Streptomyces sp. NPDC088731]|uniref:hypothetical protein n=1 Tax=Streptomyces sp. NPDC088731 TaxID=3365878 RepID=UPI0038105B8B
MGKDYNWETVLSTYTTATPTSRMDIGGSGDGYNSWFEKHAINTTDYDPYFGPDGYDFYWSFTWTPPATKVERHIQMGLTLSRLVGSNDTDTPLYKFVHEPFQYLEPALTDGGSDVIKLHSFDDAGMAVRGVQQLLDQWSQQLAKLGDGIDVPDSEFQGSAAGSLKNVLAGIGGELTQIVRQLTKPDWTKELDAARTQLQTSTEQLRAAHEKWLNTPESMPVNHIRPLWLVAVLMLTLDMLVSDTDTPTHVAFGDPHDQAFWDRMEATAKQGWLGHVGQMLDPAAHQQGNDLDTAYQGTADEIRDLQAPTWITPYSGSGSGNSEVDKAKQQLEEEQKKLEQQAKDQEKQFQTQQDQLTKQKDQQQQDLKDQQDDLKKQSEDQQNSLTKQTDDLNKQADALKNGPDTKVPPPGATQDQQKQLDDLKKQADQLGTGNGTTYNANNLPPGSKVNEDGTVTGPNGLPLKNPDGSTVKVPPGTKVPSGGTTEEELRRQQQQQRRTLQQEAEAQERWFQQQRAQQEAERKQALAQQRQYEQSLQRAREQVRSSGSEELLRNAGKGGTLKMRNADGTFSESRRNPLTGEEVAPGTGRVRTTSTEPDVKGAEQTAATGRRTSSQSPMMPPPGGGGAPAGQEQHRERKSYLDEDEDTWGTQECSTTGVIG